MNKKIVQKTVIFIASALLCVFATTNLFAQNSLEEIDVAVQELLHQMEDEMVTNDLVTNATAQTPVTDTETIPVQTDADAENALQQNVAGANTSANSTSDGADGTSTDASATTSADGTTDASVPVENVLLDTQDGELDEEVLSVIEEATAGYLDVKNDEAALTVKPYVGWKVTVPASAENPNEVIIATFDGKEASVTVAGGNITDMQVLYIGRALDAVWNLPGLSIALATVQVESSDRFRFVLFPEKFTHADVDLSQYLLSGLKFTYYNSLVYDVVLKVNELKPRIRGTFVSAEDFVGELYRATLVPDLYMYDNDLAERVARLEQALLSISARGLFSRPVLMDETIIQFVKNMYNENKQITKKEVIAELRNQKIKFANADIDTIFAVLLGVYE